MSIEVETLEVIVALDQAATSPPEDMKEEDKPYADTVAAMK